MLSKCKRSDASEHCAFDSSWLKPDCVEVQAWNRRVDYTLKGTEKQFSALPAEDGSSEGLRGPPNSLVYASPWVTAAFQLQRMSLPCTDVYLAFVKAAAVLRSALTSQRVPQTGSEARVARNPF
jgi:hypothetical protein